VVGRRPDRTRTLAAQLGVPHGLSDLDEALALPGLRAVSIATPPDTHAEYAIRAARAGLHVLCEKPMARSLSEARSMRDATRAAGVAAMVDHEFRFDPARATLARLIHAGVLGTPQLATCIALSPLYVDPYRPAPAWWFDAARGGGWLGASGSHMLDALRVWLGEVQSVAALVDHAEARPGVGQAADATFSLLLQMASGATGILQQSAASWGPRLTLVRVTGSEATAWIDERWRLWVASAQREAAQVEVEASLQLPRVAVPDGSGPFARWELPAFVRMAERFADAIDGRAGSEPCAATFDDGVAVQGVMDAARRAAREHRWVDIEPACE